MEVCQQERAAGWDLCTPDNNGGSYRISPHLKSNVLVAVLNSHTLDRREVLQSQWTASCNKWCGDQKKKGKTLSRGIWMLCKVLHRPERKVETQFWCWEDAGKCVSGAAQSYMNEESCCLKGSVTFRAAPTHSPMKWLVFMHLVRLLLWCLTIVVFYFDKNKKQKQKKTNRWHEQYKDPETEIWNPDIIYSCTCAFHNVTCEMFQVRNLLHLLTNEGPVRVESEDSTSAHTMLSITRYVLLPGCLISPIAQ